MTSLVSRSALSALSAHRFLMRAALAATMSFAWVFALQYLYGLYGDITDAFLRVIMLYELSQVVTILATPYSALQLHRGSRSRMVAGVLICILAFCIFAAALAGLLNPILGLISFAMFIGLYRALYWVPYAVEMEREMNTSQIPQEIFIAFMPAIAGYALVGGTLGAAILLFAGATILIASLAPLLNVPEIHERYRWSYGETFAELFEAKYNSVVEPAFLSGLQGATLLLLWPLSVFIIVGLSYQLLGLVLSATLLIAVLLRSRIQKLLRGRDFLYTTMAATAWILRLAVTSPLTVVFVNAYAAPTDTSSDLATLEQFADNGTYIDEYTVLKEIAMSIGRITMCIVGVVCISVLSLPVGIAFTFVLAGAASAVSYWQSKRVQEF